MIVEFLIFPLILLVYVILIVFKDFMGGNRGF